MNACWRCNSRRHEHATLEHISIGGSSTSCRPGCLAGTCWARQIRLQLHCMMGALAHPFEGEELPLEPQLLLLDWSLLPEYAVTQGPPGAGGGAFPGGPSKAVTWHVYKTPISYLWVGGPTFRTACKLNGSPALPRFPGPAIVFSCTASPDGLSTCRRQG